LSGLSDSEELSGYAVEIAMELHRGADAELEDEQYERVRAAMVRHEDAMDPPLRVVLTRRAPQGVAAEDLPDVLAACREAMIDVLGVAADHPGVAWEFRQSEGPAALVVEVAAVR